MLNVVSSMPFRLISLTTGGAAGAPLVVVAAPLPPSPWHAEHCSSKIGAPWAAVPLPAGKPAPSGSISMSHAAMSAGLIGLPRFGACANAAPMSKTTVHKPDSSRSLRIGMGDLAFLVDSPARDRIEMMIFESEERRNRRQLAARGDELGARRLRVSGLVPGPALQHGGTAVPLPGHAEPGERHAQHRLLERGFCPALPAVGRDHDL